MNYRFIVLGFALLLMAAGVRAAAPAVSIDAPIGSDYIGGGYTISWSATDRAYTAPLAFNIYYSTTEGAEETLIAADLAFADYCTDPDGNIASELNPCYYDWDTSTATDGNYFIDIRVSADGVSDLNSSNGSFMLDNNAPTVVYATPSTWQNSNFNIELLMMDFGSRLDDLNYTIDSGPLTWGFIWGTVRDYNILIDTDGNHTVYAYVGDKAGNVRAAGPIYAPLDKTSPSIQIFSPGYPDANVSAISLGFDVNDSGGSDINEASIEVGVNAAIAAFNINCTAYDGNFRCLYNALLVEETAGDYEVKVNVSDYAGNEADTNSIVEHFNNVPEVRVLSPDGGGVINVRDNNGIYAISFRVTDVDEDDLNAGIWYSTVSTGEITTYAIVADLNLFVPGVCDDTNFATSPVCSYDWNLSNVGSGDFVIDINVFDGRNVDSDSSNESFKVFDWLFSNYGWATMMNTQKKIVRTDDGNIHLAYSDTNGTDFAYSVYYASSDDNGLSWSTPIKISGSLGFSALPAIAKDSNENLHVVWQDSTPGAIDVYYSICQSNEGENCQSTKNWSSPLDISNTPNNSGYAVIAVDSDDNIHVALIDGLASDYDIIYKSCSSDCNVLGNWSADLNVSANSTGAFYPSLSIDNSDALHLLWTDVADTSLPDANILYKYCSGDCSSGANWSSDVNIGDLNAATGFGLPILITDSLNGVHVVWGTPADVNSDIFYRRCSGSCYELSNWDENVNISSNSGMSLAESIIADSSNNLHVVWSDDSEDANYDIHYRRYNYSRSAWEDSINLTNNSKTDIYPNLRGFTEGSDILDFVYLQIGSSGDEDYNIVLYSQTIDTGTYAPALVSPSNGTSQADSTPEFEWGDVVDTGVSYSLEILTTSLQTVFKIDNLGATSYTLEDSDRLDNETYYWRVSATDTSNNTATSESFTLTITSSSSDSGQPSTPPASGWSPPISSGGERAPIAPALPVVELEEKKFDLKICSFADIDENKEDNIIRLEICIENQRENNSEEFSVIVFNESDNNSIIYEKILASLASGGNTTVSFDAELEAGKNMKFIAVVTAKSGIKDFDESNNIANLEVEIPEIKSPLVLKEQPVKTASTTAMATLPLANLLALLIGVLIIIAIGTYAAVKYRNKARKSK